MSKLIHEDLTYKINGLLFKTHNDLGRYLNEKQYADYFEKLLNEEKIKYVREYRIKDIDKGQGKTRCICDFIIEDIVILEFKTKSFIDKEDYYQTQRYLATLNIELGLLVNFRQKRLVPKRVLNSAFIK